MKAEIAVDQIEIIPRSQSVGVRFFKRVMNGEKVMSEAFHRIMLDPLADLEATVGMMNRQMEVEGFPPVQLSDVALIQEYMDMARR